MNEMTQERESRILEKAVDMYGHLKRDSTMRSLTN